jgi:putative ABC transport system permease protein
MMLGLARQTIRDRRASFYGSLSAVVLGTAVLTGAVSLIVAVGTSEFPGAQENARGGVIALLVFILIMAAFLSVFLVSSTVSFSVATRSRELALFRVVGATSAQVRRLVRSETTILALVGALIGLPVGFAFGASVAGILASTDLARGLEYSLSTTMLAVAAPIGLGGGVLVTFLGSHAAARRVGRIPLIEALHEVDLDRDAMPGKRWVAGLVFLTAGVVLMALSSRVGPDGLVPLGIFLGFPLVLSAALLSPVLVRPFATLFAGTILRFTSVGGWIAAHTVRQNIRRSASTMAPVLLVVGVAGSILGTAGVFGAATEQSTTRQYAGDIVVAGPPDIAALGEVEGVQAATPVGYVELQVSTRGAEPDRSVGASTVSPESLSSVFDLPGLDGTPEGGIVAGEATARTFGWEVGQEIAVETPDGTRHTTTLAATFTDNPLQENVIVPDELAESPPGAAVVHLTVAEDADAAEVSAHLAASVGVEAQTTEEWSASVGDDQSSGLRYGAWVLAGLALVYAGLSVVNTTFMSFRDRLGEFVQLSRVGATTRQIRWMVVWESVVVAGTGVVMGSLIAVATSSVLSGVLGGVVEGMPLRLPVGELMIVGALSAGLAVTASQLAVPRTSRT